MNAMKNKSFTLVCEISLQIYDILTTVARHYNTRVSATSF